MPEEFVPPPPTDPAPHAVPPPPPTAAAGFVPNFGYPPPRAPYLPLPPAPRRSAWFYIATIGGSVAAVALVLWALGWATMRSAMHHPATGAFSGSSIAVIDLSGVLLEPDKFDEELRRFADDSSVKAIILHINSPGGGAAASQEMYHEVVRVRRETHKPIVASIESVGASGAYYVASACDRIYANDASVVGSIGVIMEWTNYGDLMRWAKLKSVVIHAGELKDAGDPSRDMTPKEAAYFQSLVDNMYSQFVHDVATGRHTTDSRIRPLATGQVWTGQQALPLGLIDKQGGFRTALIDTARSVSISGEPTVVRPAGARKGLLALLTQGDADNLFPNPTRLLDRAPGFYFLWK